MQNLFSITSTKVDKCMSNSGNIREFSDGYRLVKFNQMNDTANRKYDSYSMD